MPTFENVAVVGMHFRERDGIPAKEIVSNFVPPLELTLEREPMNPYDHYAIKVLYQDQHIGYIEATSACFIAPYLDEGETMTCTVTSLEPRGRNLHPITEIKMASAD